MTAEEYVELPYHIILVRDEWEDGTVGWFAEVEELRGCMSQGATPDEAIERVRDAMLGWIFVALEDGKDIPLPRSETHYSGRFLLRMPRGLHRDLARQAEREQTSLNQFVVALLAGATSWRGRTVPTTVVQTASEPALKQVISQHTDDTDVRKS